MNLEHSCIIIESKVENAEIGVPDEDQVSTSESTTLAMSAIRVVPSFTSSVESTISIDSLSGRALVRGTEFSVARVYLAFVKSGFSLSEVSEGLPGLSLDQLREAREYAEIHREEMAFELLEEARHTRDSLALLGMAPSASGFRDISERHDDYLTQR
ncbi:MAG: DUF433 domain-containing protein [Planctomycetota bacterium]|nr:DUF433 domain-containing protein [Planctomycetota bacterium]